ncbi:MULTISPECIES: DUF397 domain-containing protein [Actinomadura]|uniref:DUF397 domain-containing protein n=1 Tax=Actinomadura madurae TaxID=1993 RepID=A0A1I5MBY5_9ACTN|nr:DUF397 domain-containing protein [Actinomadura madurae]SFP06466.1 protein of unknown function [Actinomadura madurae]SPT60947.1 Domain of uncharacterised function (DUF397) [Actinomadura madurae]
MSGIEKADGGREGRAHATRRPAPRWGKSSYCASDSYCVEVARLSPGRAGVRDAKNPAEAPFLTFGSIAWGEFLARVKENRYDVR